MPEQIAQYEEEVKSKARVESTSSLSDKDIKVQCYLNACALACMSQDLFVPQMEVDEDNRIDDVFEVCVFKLRDIAHYVCYG